MTRALPAPRGLLLALLLMAGCTVDVIVYDEEPASGDDDATADDDDDDLVGEGEIALPEYWAHGYCPGYLLPASFDCGGIDDKGCCVGEHTLLYCQVGLPTDILICVHCSEDGNYCGWMDNGDLQSSYYECVPVPTGPEPTKTVPMECPDGPE